MQSAGNKAKGRQNNSQRNMMARVSNLNTQLRGTKFNPPPQPRPFTAIPWNSLTVEIEQPVEDAATAELVLTAASVSTAIQAKVGSIPKFKVQRYECWSTASGLSYPTLKAEFYDLSDQAVGALEPRSQQSDRGTLNMPAKVGFLPPMTDQKRILSSTDGATVLAKFNTGEAVTGLTLLSRVHVLWVYSNASF